MALLLLKYGLTARINVLGVFKAHLPFILDAGTVLLSVPSLISAGFVYCHCTGRWAVLDNAHCKDIGAYR